MATQQHSSEIKAQRNRTLSGHAVRGWLATLPEDVAIGGLLGESGEQRDPYTVFVGLRATWIERVPDLPDIPGATVTRSSVYVP